MLLSLLYALAPIAAGGALVLFVGRGQRWMGPLRTLALTAALALVLAEILPTAVTGLGALAVLVCAAALLLPMIAERLGEHAIASVRAPGLELAFGALLLHQVIDGLQVGAARELTEGGLAVALTIAAHSAPLIATAVFGYVSRLGGRAAVQRLWWLGVATGGGVVLGHLTGTEWFLPVTPWIQATMAGLLLHILSHDLDVNPPQHTPDRVADIIAAGVGVALPLLLLPGEHHTHSHPDFLHVVQEVTGLLAPVLLVVVGVLAGIRGGGVVSGLRETMRTVGPWIFALLLGLSWGVVCLPGWEEALHALPEAGAVFQVCGVILLGLLLWGIWQLGTRRWFQALIGFAHSHHHHHGDDHDHATSAEG